MCWKHKKKSKKKPKMQARKETEEAVEPEKVREMEARTMEQIVL